jgi:hypothetical protein
VYPEIMDTPFFRLWEVAHMRRVTLTMTEGEIAALVKLARRERRDPRQQAALVLREALEQRGFLTEGKIQECEAAHGADSK